MMPASGPWPGRVAVQVSLAAIFVSLELSRSTWLITSLMPGGGDKMSKHLVRSGDVAELLNHLTKLRDKAHARAGASFPIIAIQEAGLDGFWVHRVLVLQPGLIGSSSFPVTSPRPLLVPAAPVRPGAGGLGIRR